MKASGIIYELFLVLISLYFIDCVDPNYKPGDGIFQHQLSFAGPFGGTHIPFWETSGAALVLDNYVRLTPNQRSQRGAIWSTRPLKSKDWEVMIRFSIGSDSRLGADGLAFWLTKERAITGPIMGSTNKWRGLGVIVDTFDNDGQRDNPQIYAVYNENWFELDSSDDGKMNGLGICSANIRQITQHPEEKLVKLVVRVKDKLLSVFYDSSEISGGEAVWTECITAKINFPDDNENYYLGLTAETGGLSDFHDIKSITTWSLSQKKNNPPEIVPKEESKDSAIPDIERPPKQYISRDSLKETTAPEIISRLSELEKKDDIFALTIDSKFKEMQQKLEAMEREQIQLLSRIYTNVDSVRSSLDVSKLIELKQDVKSTLSSLNAVKERIDNIESHVEGTNQRTADLKYLHDTKSNELRALVEKNTSWGFWTYLLIFQVLFWGAFIMWRRSEKPQEKKFI